MSIEKLQFVLPPPGAAPSGGHRFNGRMLAEARKRGFPLHAVTCGPDGDLAAVPLDPGAPVLWDSLFLGGLARLPALPAAQAHGLLLHYLPSLDPGLSAGRRETLEIRIAAALEPMSLLVATGEGLADLLRQRYPGRRVAVVEPGVDALFAAPRPPRADPGTVRLITVANLLPAKGLWDLLDHLAELRELPWEWHLVGSDAADPAYGAVLRSRVRALGLTLRVVFHGALESGAVAARLGAADLFVFPSRYESYGLALAEAAAAGLPILTTAVGEAARLVRPGETGVVVPADDTASFRAALRQLILEPELRARLRRRASARGFRTWAVAFDDFSRALADWRVETALSGRGGGGGRPPPGSSPA